MIVETFPDLTSLWHNVTTSVILDPELWDETKPPRLFSFPNLLTAETHYLEADLSWVGLTRSRWTRFLNQYIDLDSLHQWIETCQHAEGLTSILWRTKTKEEGFEHTGGACLIALSYRPKPATLTIYSREVEFPMRGLLDAALASQVVEAIGRGPARVSWLMGGLFISMLHAVPFLVHYGLLDKYRQMDTKSGNYINYMADHLLKHREEIKYGPAKRIYHRWQSMVGNGKPLLPVPTGELPLYLNGRRRDARVG